MSVRVKFHKDSWWVFAAHQYNRKAWKIGSKADAQDFARGVRDTVQATGKLADPRKTSTMPTLSEYFERFESGHMRSVKGKTAKCYRDSYRRWIEPQLGKIHLDKLDRRRVKDFVDGLKEARWKRTKSKDATEHPLARDTVRLIVGTLRVILAEAFDDKLISSNPASELRARYRDLPRVHEISPFSEEEIVTLLETASTESAYWFAYFATLFHAGLRPGEGIALKGVDFPRRILNVRATATGRRLGKSTKTGRSRQVEMSEFLSGVLKDLLVQRKQEWPALPEFCFCTGEGTMVDYANMRRYFDAVLTKAKLKGRGLHQLRHSFATIHLQNGTPIEWVSRQLGHQDVKTTYQHYYHYLPDRQKEKYTGVLPAIGMGNVNNVIPMRAKGGR